MNLYQIKQRLTKQEKSVLTTNEIARILNIKKEIASVYINRAKKKGLIYKIERKKISLTNDPFIVASQLIYPVYISLTSALYLHNLIPQVINSIYLLSPKKRKPIRIFNTDIIFINVNPKFMFGYRKIKKGNSFIMLADLEKTIIDCINFVRYCRLNYLLPAIKKADIKKLESYLLILNKESLNRRIGYLLDLVKIKHNIKRNGIVVYKLNPTIKKKGDFNKKWYLYINEEL